MLSKMDEKTTARFRDIPMFIGPITFSVWNER